MSADYDLIVVGAGPAGGTAALQAAKAGMRVALIERHRLPRHKTCGGGVPMAVSADLPHFDPQAHADCTIRFMRHTFRFQQACMAPIQAPGDPPDFGLWCVRRDVFDHALTAAAVNTGAELFDGLTLETVEPASGAVQVQARNGLSGAPWRAVASFVIGADGANGVVGRQVGLHLSRTEAIALEALVPHRWGEGHPSLRPDTIHLEYGAVRNGYAWVFPNAEQLNIGAGFLRAAHPLRGPAVREALMQTIRAYAAALGLEPDWDRVRFRAHPLPVWSRRNTLDALNARVLLVGDVAALVNPLFGDGILNAVRSAALAVQCILEGQPAAYSSRLHSEIGTELQAASRLSALFYRLPGECFRYGVTRPTATRTAALLLNGRLKYREIAPRAMRRLMQAITGRRF